MELVEKLRKIVKKGKKNRLKAEQAEKAFKKKKEEELAPIIIERAEKKLKKYCSKQYETEEITGILIHTFYFFEFGKGLITCAMLKKHFEKIGFNVSIKRSLSREGDASVGIRPSYNHQVWLSW